MRASDSFDVALNDDFAAARTGSGLIGSAAVAGLPFGLGLAEPVHPTGGDKPDGGPMGLDAVTHALSTAVPGSVVHQAGDAVRSTEAAFDPEAPALMLAGLAVLGFVAHRRGTST